MRPYARRHRFLYSPSISAGARSFVKVRGISMSVTISETERLVEPLSVVRRLLFTLDFHRSSMCQSAGNEQRDVVSSMATVCNPVVLSAAMPTPDGIRLIAFAAVPSGQQPGRAASLANVSTTAINNGRRLPGDCCAVRLRVRTVARPAAGGVGQQPIAPRPRQLF